MNRLLQLVGWRRDPSMTARPGPTFASSAVAIVFVIVAVLIIVGLNRLY